MPELVEVEAFRLILLPLVSSSSKSQKNPKQLLNIQLAKESPPKVFLTPQDIADLQNNCYVTDVVRKGKLLCMMLRCIKPILRGQQQQKEAYLYLHMGMTGRISSPTASVPLKSMDEAKNKDYPPPHTYLKFSTTPGGAEACFSDPRKFGSVELVLNQDKMDQLAPDALLWCQQQPEDSRNNIKASILEGLSLQSTPIKAILLDQKRVVSGVGNWIADEVLYQCEMHPEQTLLTLDEATILLDKLSEILRTGVDHISRNGSFPDDWIFHFRWTTRRRQDAKDAKGRAIKFVKSGGRTSAIVPSIQKVRGRNGQATGAENHKEQSGHTGGLLRGTTESLTPGDNTNPARPRRNVKRKTRSGD